MQDEKEWTVWNSQAGSSNAETILGHEYRSASSPSNEWFGVEAIAGIAVTSEADGAPVENVLCPDRETGWRASEPGLQIIRITFAAPPNIRHIQLAFRESQFARTQEFTLRCTVCTRALSS
ncbi:MAG: hypothetical protein JO108_22310 [Acidobacteriaceae bacterium]|nr:hypothetical protein [Acidobacteriaceae bacterium]